MSPNSPRYFVTTKAGVRIDTGCTIMINDRGMVTFHLGPVKSGPVWGFAPGHWTLIEWATK